MTNNGKVEVMDDNFEVQTSIRHSKWLRFLIEQSKGLIPTAGGKKLSNADIFIYAAGLFATQTLKNVGTYEQLKSHYVLNNGAVQEYDSSIKFGGNGDSVIAAEIDPLFDEGEDDE